MAKKSISWVAVAGGILLLCNLAWSAMGFRGWVKWSQAGDRAVLSLDLKNLLVIDSGGQELSRISFENPILEISISPDGSRLALVIEKEGLWTMDMDGKNRKWRSKHMCSNLQWSPGGEKLLYTALESGGDQKQVQLMCYLLDIKTGEIKEVYAQKL